MFKKFMIIAITVAVAACAETRHYVDGHSIDNTRPVKNDTDYFLNGFLQDENIDANNVCGKAENVVATETKKSVMNNVIGLLTLGIYTPQEQTVYCRQ